MAYTNTNFKTKKALKDALAAGQDVGVHEPGFARSRRTARSASRGRTTPSPTPGTPPAP